MARSEPSLPLPDSLYRAHTLKDIFKLDETAGPKSLSFFSVTNPAQMDIQGNWVKVILKTYHKINEPTAAKAAQRTRQEFMAWLSLASSSGKCENITQFYGVCFVDPKLIPEATQGIPSIVTEYIKYGSIEYTEGQDPGVRLDVVCQLANGLSFMHSLDIIHGDMNPNNFRVTEGGVVKIIDLGLSRKETVEHTGFTTTILPSYMFIAPELIVPDQDDVSMFVTKASDVYAFSMTGLQILDGQGFASRPFNQCQGPYKVRKALITDQWPQEQRYPGVSPQCWKILSACWTNEPLIRPTIDALFGDLTAVSL